MASGSYWDSCDQTWRRSGCSQTVSNTISHAGNTFTFSFLDNKVMKIANTVKKRWATLLLWLQQHDLGRLPTFAYSICHNNLDRLKKPTQLKCLWSLVFWPWKTASGLSCLWPRQRLQHGLDAFDCRAKPDRNLDHLRILGLVSLLLATPGEASAWKQLPENWPNMILCAQLNQQPFIDFLWTKHISQLLIFVYRCKC